MGSMERAPEPTMEEILASIRRIISDDEAKSADAKPAPLPEKKAAAIDAEADTKIIDDIARVLSGGSPAEAESDDEDILDLTKELSELQTAADDSSELPELELTTPAPAQIIEEAAPEPEPVITLGAPEPVMPMPESPRAEEPSALELAIAELRARHLQSSPEPESVFGMPPLPEPEPEPELELVEESELVMASIETETIEVTDDPFAGPTIIEHETEPSEAQFEAPSWLSQAEPPASELEPVHTTEPEPEPESAPQINGNGSHGGRTTHYTEFGINPSNRTLEESVKEMLRPLLREWLDEHMSRVLEAALRDELKDAEARWQRNEQRRRPY
jgi:cell pole-organizing protein PopZ